MTVLCAMRILAFIALLPVAGCQSSGTSTDVSASTPALMAPAPGTVVAVDSIQHTDALNTFTFRVTITKASEAGVYTVEAVDGPNRGTTQFTMPKGATDYPVAMRRGGTSRMEIGFRMPDEPTFYPYYEVVAENKTIRAQYTNAYKFE
ncbi:MAG: hypothetical protein EOP52_02015 [Sphingobacteriales bacterium]|nr:MAG: hypothetical protein EOP52_02015 [Sphingobacteriales bacterium]